MNGCKVCSVASFTHKVVKKKLNLIQTTDIYILYIHILELENGHNGFGFKKLN